MERILIKNLHDHIGKEATIMGSVDVRRDQGKMIFFDFRDRSGKVQGVVLPKSDAMETAKEARNEFAVAVSGVINTRPEKNVQEVKKHGDIELEIKHIDILGKAQELPFDESADLNLDTLLDYRPLTLRRPREKAIFTVQHEIIQAYRDFLTSEDFKEFEAPKLVGDDAEGGGNVFRLDYFNDKSAYLATSPQLYKQIMVGVFERVFSIGNVFRAEKHATTRHLNEYTSLDAECGFISDHLDLMRLETRLMRFIFARLKERCAKEFEIVGAAFPEIPGGDCFPHMKLREAQALISKETGNDCTNEPDLEPEHERWLCNYAKEKLGSDFIFITHYPVSKRPFYTYEDENDPGFTKSFDLLFRGIEITTGGQRIHSYDTLIEKLRAKKLDPENFSYYLQAFKYGMPPHGGWGMGLERLTEKFLDLPNVKEATLFPRDINRIDVLLSK
jgi:nondiscriminating aspartyl-tRNA synthetase